MATNQTVAEVIEMLNTNYGEQTNPGRIRLWRAELADIGDAQLYEAARQHIRSSKWYPKLSEILHLARNVTLPSPARPKHHPLYLRLWQMVKDCNYDPTDFEALAEEMEGADLENGAAECRQRAADYREEPEKEEFFVKA